MKPPPQDPSPDRGSSCPQSSEGRCASCMWLCGVGKAQHPPPAAGAHRQPPGEGAFPCWLSPRSKSSGWRRGWRNFPRAHHRCCSLVSKGNAAYAMTDACPSRPHQLRDPPAASNPNPGGTMPPRCRVPPKRGEAEQQTPVRSLPTGRGQLSASGCSNPARVSAEPGTQAASPPPSQGRDLGAWSSSRAGGGQGLQPPPPAALAMGWTLLSPPRHRAPAAWCRGGC